MEKNWESYDKPKYNRMMAEGSAEPVLISIDTSGSTEYLVSSSGRTYLDSYKKLANDILDEFSTASEFIIVNHGSPCSGHRRHLRSHYSSNHALPFQHHDEMVRKSSWLQK